MTRRIPYIPNPDKFEILSDAISISIRFDPGKLINLLIGVAACDEMRRQLKRRNTGVLVRIYETENGGDISEESHRQFINYEIRLERDDVPLEYVPLREWPRLAERLNLYLGRSDARLKREAEGAIQYFRDLAHDKLVRVLRQFLFEGLHAATGKPVTEEKRRELEEIGTMVDRSWELRAAGTYSPADLRNWKTPDFKQVLLMAIRDVVRKQQVTYERVAALMQREHEFVPILTGETLRKVVNHHRLSWKELKNGKSD